MLVERRLCIKWITCVVEKCINKLLKNGNGGLSGAAARTKFLNINTYKKINKNNRGLLTNGGKHTRMFQKRRRMINYKNIESTYRRAFGI